MEYYYLLESVGTLINIPEKYRTYQLCLNSLKNNRIDPDVTKSNLRHVPPEFINYELCMIGINHHGHGLKYVPEYLKTDELCKIAIDKYKYGYEYVPEKYKTYKFWYDLVGEISIHLYNIPKMYHTYELISKRKYCIDSCDILTTYELCKKYVMEHPILIYTLPIKTREFYEIAVSKCFSALRFVPDHYKDQKMYYLAINGDIGITRGNPFTMLPEYLLTYEIYYKINSKYAYALAHIPETMITYEICVTAIGNDYRNIMYLPNNLRNYDVYFEMIKINSQCSETLIEEKIINESDSRFRDFYIEAVNNGADLRYLVSDNMMTYEMAKNMLKFNGRFPPEHLIDEEMAYLIADIFIHLEYQYNFRYSKVIKKILDNKPVGFYREIPFSFQHRIHKYIKGLKIILFMKN